MSDDLLERAASVVRDRYDGQSKRAAATEDRLISAFARQTRRRKRLPMIAIPLVAALLGSVAWGRVADKLHALIQTWSGTPTPSTGTMPKHVAASAPSIPIAVPSAPIPEASASSATVAATSGRPAQRSATIRKPNSTSRPVASPTPSEVDTLYRTAHRAQFSGGDPSQAVLLWDRYLAAAPNGSLSPEARYNRAIALARLGRKAEAATALEPFARGDYGGYRKTEAELLLGVLRPAAPP